MRTFWLCLFGTIELIVRLALTVLLILSIVGLFYLMVEDGLNEIITPYLWSKL